MNASTVVEEPLSTHSISGVISSPIERIVQLYVQKVELRAWLH